MGVVWIGVFSVVARGSIVRIIQRVQTRTSGGQRMAVTLIVIRTVMITRWVRIVRRTRVYRNFSSFAFIDISQQS